MTQNRPLYTIKRKTDDLPKPPKGLRAAGKALWRTVVETFELEPYQLKTLFEAARCVDTIERCEAAIRRYGVTIEGRFGLKSNPACQTAVQNRTVYARLMRELGLDAIMSEAARPTTLYGGRRR